MGKKVIRLTEADIENIVKKVIQEQEQIQNEFNFYGLGLFEIKGDGLYFRYDESEEQVKIWEKGAAPSFKWVNSRFVPDGYLKTQFDLFYNNTQNRPIIRKIGGKEGFTLPNTRPLLNPKKYTSIPYIMLRDDGKLQGANTTIRAISKNLLQDTARLTSYGAMDDELTRSRDGIAKFRETYVRIRRSDRGDAKKLKYAVVFVGFGLVSNPIKPAPPKNTTPPKNIKLSLSLQDVFKFDEINFKNESEALSQLDNFVKQINDYIAEYGDLFREKMKEKLDIKPILGYASIDRNPSDKEIGKLPGCQGKTTNGEYNKCLSNMRAKKVADYLNSKFKNDEMINFKYKGMGGTDQLSEPKGKKWPKYKPNETGENRKIILDLGEFRLSV